MVSFFLAREVPVTRPDYFKALDVRTIVGLGVCNGVNHV